jgi:hypothetical protein
VVENAESKAVVEDPVIVVWHGHPMRASQVQRIAESKARLTRLREVAGYKILNGASRDVGVNCARCEYIGDFNGEHQSGYCGLLRHMVATHYQVRCASFVPRTKPKAEDVLKAQMARQEAERRGDA